MPIAVTCPSCHARFQVSDKFAGQTGPCPKCKNPIRIPKPSEEVIVHAPDEFGPKDASGRAVLKPLEREDTSLSPVAIAGIGAAIVGTLAIVFIVGRVYEGSADGIPIWLLGVGAVLLGPPVSAAGYAMLRDHELEPFRGSALWLRCLVCGLIYASLWAAYWFVKGQLFEGEVEMFHLVFLAPALVAAGGVAGMACLELDYTSGALHYAIYLLVTCLLRLLAGLSLY